MTKKLKLLSALILALFMSLTIFGVFEVFSVKTEYNLDQFFPTNHHLLKQNENIKNRFHLNDSSPLLIVAKLKDDTKSWTAKPYLSSLKKLTIHLQQSKFVEEVQSLSTLQGASPSDQGLGIGLLIDHMSPQKLNLERKTNAILSPNFLSKNGKVLNILITLNPSTQKNIEVAKSEILTISKNYLSFAEISLGGVPAIQSDVKQVLHQEILQFIIIAFFLSLTALIFIFKNLSPIIISSVLAFMTNILSVWGISVLGFSFNVLSTTIPILITMTVISISLHSILRFTERYSKELNSKNQTLVETFIELFRPNLLTALTTSLGFFTLTLSESPLVKEFGFSVGVALLITWINTALVLPAFLTFFNPPEVRSWMSAKARWPFFLFKFHRSFFTLLVFITIGGAWIGKDLSWRARLFDDLPKDHQVRKTTALVDQYLGGIVPLELEIRWPKSVESPWSEEKRLQQLETLSKDLRKKTGVGSVISLTDIFQSSGLRNKPQRTPASEVLFLFSMAEKSPVEHFLSSDGRSTRLALRLNDLPGSKMWYLVQDIRKLVQKTFPQAQVLTGGTAAYIHDINNTVSLNLLFGFWQAMVIIFILLLVTYRSLGWAILACIPNLTPPALLLGALSLWEIPIKPGISIILSISLGLAFNNTVYLLERLRQYIQKGYSFDKSLMHTFWSEANACFFSSLVLALGFSGFAVSYFKMNQMFGVFMVLSVLTGLLGDLVLLPTMLKTFGKYHKFQGWMSSFKSLKSIKTIKSVSVFLLFTLLTLFAPKSFSADPALDSLLEKLKLNIITPNESGNLTMKIIEKDGTEKRKELSYSRLSIKDTHYTKMQLKYPKDLRGTALLSVMKNQKEEKWIYLPSSRQTRKILTTQQQNSKILESELYTEDFNLNHLKIKKNKILQKTPTLKVDSQFSKPLGLYSRALSEFRPDGLLSKLDLFDKKGKLLKTFTFLKYVEMKKKWRALEVEIKNVQNSRKTYLIFSDLQLDGNLKENNFSIKSLSEN